MEHDDEDSFSGSDSSNYGTENLISKEEGELKDGKSMQNLMINLNF